MDVCPNGALSYRRGRHQLSIPMLQPVGEPPAISTADAATTDIRPLDRRAFLLTGAVLASSLAAEATSKVRQHAAATGLLTPLNPVTPPGIKSRRDFMMRCTGCGICVTACPSGVISISGMQYSLRNILHPVMDFSNSFCRYDCVRCTEVRPDATDTGRETQDTHWQGAHRHKRLHPICRRGNMRPLRATMPDQSHTDCLRLVKRTQRTTRIS